MEDLFEWLKTLPCGADHDTFLDELTDRLDAAGYRISRKPAPEPPLFETHPVGNGTVTLHRAYRKDWAAN